ncbi:ribosome-releasing factor 2, mitochondrial [Metschnikowia bicuspidata var. bicuspidata NRRL YB-4993]|uniref:Ribosome-releasing factor 2, mitochondrial n=1 Tax=Metschnikowia bicuspidata var. bicuspidata NRRL YB-4993 TaxID=869754 RepID=A0A1A0HA63_9ASCO|nr:ribosome-releasing factor 2, mitochondrial [Metschnikowia bicuspidata var. bicuspidata NRRL YB-4993]OBA20767.1 ribosome-releasing factor 2, mitochondrial [Metschnikowia bicuspidata var. bicuspidata NRRL YB-4993]
MRALARGARLRPASTVFQRPFHGSGRLNEPKLNTVAADKTRNIGIIAHIDAGKTTTTERMLFYSGKTLRIGNVDQGDTVTDYLPSERERGITIQLAAISIPWNNHKINIIDTPGHADFTFEVTRALRVLDGAVTILDAVAGVEAQTEKVWRQAHALRIPRIAYVNKMDRPGAGFSRTVKELVAKLQTRAVCLSLPYFQRGDDGDLVFRGTLDVLHKKLLLWDAADASGRTVRAVDLDAADAQLAPLHDMVRRSRECMVETLGDMDDAVIEEFLECGEDYMAVSAGTLGRAIRSATLACHVTPVLCGSSFRNVGVQPLMDAVLAYLASPLQAALPEVTSTTARLLGKRRRQAELVTRHVPVPMAMDARRGLVLNNSPNLTVALAFKVMTHPGRGVLTFFRVYSGKLASNSTVVNTRTGHRVHFKKLMLMHGDVPEEVLAILAGNIGVVAGTHDEIVTGDTLVSHGVSGSKGFSDLEANLKLLPIDVPPPLFNSSIEPATAGDARHMNDCIAMLLREDPSLLVYVDDDLGQTVLSGMGELHLEIVRDRLVNDMKAKVRLAKVAVSYKESIAKPSAKTVHVAAADNPEVYVEIALDSFEGDAAESPFADEDGAVCLDQDNNIIILDAAATSEPMLRALDERRWKCELSLEDLQDKLLTGCATGLQIGGPLFGLPLHSCVVRVVKWNFPVAENTDSASELLEVGRRVVCKGVEQLHEKHDSLCLLEPIMMTKISVGSDVLGDVVHDLNSRCLATIVSIEDEGMDTLENQSWASSEAEKIYLPPDYTMKSADRQISNRKLIVAETPLREMVGYLSRLRSMTQGRGSFDMSYKGMNRVTKSRMVSLKSEFS